MQQHNQCWESCQLQSGILHVVKKDKSSNTELVVVSENVCCVSFYLHILPVFPVHLEQLLLTACLSLVSVGLHSFCYLRIQVFPEHFQLFSWALI